MRKGLYVAYNSYLLIEFFAMKKDFPDVLWDCYISKDYNMFKEQYEEFEKIIENTILKTNYFEKIVPNMEQKYDVILCPTFFESKLANQLREQVHAEIIYYESGLRDYISSGVMHRNPDLFLDKIMYANTPIKVQCDYYKSVRKLDITPQHYELFKEIWPFEIGYFDIAVFTYPLDVEFGYLEYKETLLGYLESTYQDKTILIKKHPRDVNNYVVPNGNNKYIVLNGTIPGQLIPSNEENLFSYPCTSILSKENCKVLKFNTDFPVNNYQYEKMFNKKFIKQNIKTLQI